MGGDGQQSSSAIMANAAGSMHRGNAAEAASLYREAAAAARKEGSGVPPPQWPLSPRPSPIHPPSSSCPSSIAAAERANAKCSLSSLHFADIRSGATGVSVFPRPTHPTPRCAVAVERDAVMGEAEAVWQTGDKALSLQCYDRALTLAQGDDEAEGMICIGKGFALLNMGENPAALGTGPALLSSCLISLLPFPPQTLHPTP